MAAGLSVGALALACSSGDEGGGSGDEGGGDEAAREVVEVMLESRDLVEALQGERDQAVAGVVGTQLVIEVPVDAAEARRLTDEAWAEFAGLAGAVSASLDVPAGVGPLRAELDARPAPADVAAGLAAMPYAEDLHARYGAVVAEVLEATDRLAVEVEVPGLRTGVQLHAEGLRQAENVRLLADILGDGSLDTPASTSEAARLYGEMGDGRAVVAELAEGTEYAAAAEQVEADLAAGLDTVVPDALRTGQANAPSAALVLTEGPGEGWRGFLDAVEPILVRQA